MTADVYFETQEQDHIDLKTHDIFRIHAGKIYMLACKPFYTIEGTEYNTSVIENLYWQNAEYTNGVETHFIRPIGKDKILQDVFILDKNLESGSLNTITRRTRGVYRDVLFFSELGDCANFTYNDSEGFKPLKSLYLDYAYLHFETDYECNARNIVNKAISLAKHSGLFDTEIIAVFPHIIKKVMFKYYSPYYWGDLKTVAAIKEILSHTSSNINIDKSHGDPYKAYATKVTDELISTKIAIFSLDHAKLAIEHSFINVINIHPSKIKGFARAIRALFSDNKLT